MGEKSDIIYIIQIILSAISVAYDEFENILPSGTYDGKTADAIREFQRINNIPETGIVDKFADNELYIS